MVTKIQEFQTLKKHDAFSIHSLIIYLLLSLITFIEVEFTLEKVLKQIQSYQSESVLKGLEHFGIPVKNAYGVKNPDIKTIAKQIGKNHELALQLWNSGKLEAQILATLLADPKKMEVPIMDNWITKIDSWPVCDAACSNVFRKTTSAYEQAISWSYLNPVFEKRAGFAQMAMLAVHDKKASDMKLIAFFDRIEAEANDDRNFVKKAINWALRSLGKRSSYLHEIAIITAEQISKQKNSASKWVAADTLRELRSDTVLNRLKTKALHSKKTRAVNH